MKMNRLKKESLNEYLLIYFTDKYKFKEKALEWSVNLNYYAGVFNFTEHLRLVGGLIEGSLNEESEC